jgi:hypothetical protein
MPSGDLARIRTLSEGAEESIAEGEEDPVTVVTSAKAFEKTNDHRLTVCGEE